MYLHFNTNAFSESGQIKLFERIKRLRYFLN